MQGEGYVEGQEMLIIDPPSGWKYGFPKKYTKKPDEDFRQWLIDNGLPEHEADFAVKYGCRFWSEED